MLLGFICVAGTATILGIMPSIQKQIMLDGLPLNSLMVYTNLIITIVCFVMAIIKKRSLKPNKSQFLQLMVMGTVGMLITAYCLNSSYLYLPVGTTIMLNFLYPSIVCIIMGLVFKNGFTKIQIAAVFISICGMFFLTGAGGKMSLIGIVFAVTSAFSYGIYLVLNEIGQANDLPLEVKLFYVSLPATIFFMIWAPATHTLTTPTTGIKGWLMIIIGSGLFTTCGYFLMMIGINRLGASTAAFVSMLEPIVSVVFSMFWFKDPITLGIVVGGILVTTSILLIAIDGANKAKSE